MSTEELEKGCSQASGGDIKHDIDLDNATDPLGLCLLPPELRLSTISLDVEPITLLTSREKGGRAVITSRTADLLPRRPREEEQ